MKAVTTGRPAWKSSSGAGKRVNIYRNVSKKAQHDLNRSNLPIAH